MASLKLFGGCSYCNVWLKNSDSDYFSSSKEIKPLTASPFSDNKWDNDTVLCANFNNNQFHGSNFDGAVGDVKYFKVYKTLGNQPKLHKVFETHGSKACTIEDFTVGSACPYKYIFYPVCKSENGLETIGSVLQSQPITLNDGIVRVIGLIQDDDFNTYYIDTDNIWHFELNTSNTGFTNNMAKTYTDTQHQYPKEIKGNGNYRTFPIEGLLGKYDCSADKYIDTYDDIIEWERFMNNNELKLVIDRRGIATLGTIDSNSFQYQEISGHAVSVSFSFKQLEDIENVDIISRQIPANPFKYDALADKDTVALRSSAKDGDAVPPFLVVPMEG